MTGDIKSQLIKLSNAGVWASRTQPRRSKTEKSDMLSRYPGKGHEALLKKAKRRKIAEASRRRNRH